MILRRGSVEPGVILVVSALVASFAVLVTAHLGIAYGLVRRKPWWRGPVALVVPPLAPLWGMEAGMRTRSGLWLFALVVYVVARIVASQ